MVPRLGLGGPISLQPAKAIEMDFVTLQILAMGAFAVAFGCVINWLERRAKENDADCRSPDAK